MTRSISTAQVGLASRAPIIRPRGYAGSSCRAATCWLYPILQYTSNCRAAHRLQADRQQVQSSLEPCLELAGWAAQPPDRPQLPRSRRTSRSLTPAPRARASDACQPAYEPEVADFEADSHSMLFGWTSLCQGLHAATLRTEYSCSSAQAGTCMGAQESKFARSNPPTHSCGNLAAPPDRISVPALHLAVTHQRCMDRQLQTWHTDVQCTRDVNMARRHTGRTGSAAHLLPAAS